jgi:DNA-binding CsgD family transcriptional regulator
MVGLGLTIFQPQAGAALPLSPREREVLELVAAGQTNREVAAALHLSPHTVKDLVSSVYRKLGAKNRADAVRRAGRLGLSSSD